MSVRAAQARKEGRFPKTDFLKEYGVSAKALQPLVDSGIISDREWHHTSKFGNKTTFYGWEEEEYADIYRDNKKEIDKIVKGKNEDGTSFIEELPKNPYTLMEHQPLPDGYWEYRNSLNGLTDEEIDSAIAKKYPEVYARMENNRLYYENETEISKVERRNKKAIAERLNNLFENALPTNEGVRFSLGKNNESLTKGKASETGQPISKKRNASPSNYDANVSKNFERAKRLDKIISNIEEVGQMGNHEFLHEIANAIKLEELKSTETSRYKKFAGGLSLRISDHYAKASNYNEKKGYIDNYGIVIKMKLGEFKPDKNVKYKEYVYFADLLTKEKQLGILEGLKTFLETKNFDAMPKPDRVHISPSKKNYSKKKRTTTRFRLTEETSNILDTMEQRNAEAYNSVTRVELPEAVTPMEIARDKKMVVMFRHAKTIILLDDKYSH